MASSIDSPFVQRGCELLGDVRRKKLIETQEFLAQFIARSISDRYYRRNLTKAPFSFHVAVDGKIWVHLKKPYDLKDANFKSITLSLCFTTGEIALKKTTFAEPSIEETLKKINKAGCLDVVIHPSQPFLADPLQKCTLLFPLPEKSSTH